MTCSFYPSQDKNARRAHSLAPLHSQICAPWNLVLQRHKAFLPQRSSIGRIVPQLEEDIILIGEKEQRNDTIRV